MPNSHESDREGVAVEQLDDGAGAPTNENDNDIQATPDLAAELAETKDRYLRAVADLDNYRKRSERTVGQYIAESREALLREWLEVVDSVERALRSEAADGPSHAGMRALLDQMETLLARHGIERFGAPGDAFDPARQEAVGVVDTTDVPDHTVAEVVRSGFALGDRVLRPAEVIVARHGDGQAP